jgi:hypothetical protein
MFFVDLMKLGNEAKNIILVKVAGIIVIFTLLLGGIT